MFVFPPFFWQEDADSSSQTVVLAHGQCFVLGHSGRLARRGDVVALPGWRANVGAKLTPAGGLAALPRLGDTRQLLELRGIAPAVTDANGKVRCVVLSAFR